MSRELQQFNSSEFALEVSKGNVPNHSSVNKFGRNIEIDSGVAADVWDGGYTVASGGTSLIWVAPTQARTHTIASTDANDTSGGTGARTVRISGLTSWSTAEVSEDITMNTGSPPVTSNSYVIIHRMFVLTKGATSVNIGDITATATTDGTVTARIRPGEGQTQMAIYGIPSTQSMYIGRIYANMNKASGGGASTGYTDAHLCVNPEPDSELSNFLVKHTFGLSLDGTSAFLVPYYVPKIIAGPAIVKIQIASGTNNMDVSAGFDAYIIDN